MVRISLIIGFLVLLLPIPTSWASEPVQKARHELMESAKDAAKPVGEMLKGERAFDAAEAMESFQTWADVALKATDLFPAGSETGFKTRSLPSVWTDRARFDEIMVEFAAAADAGIAANPQSLEELKAAAGPVFKACKSCHEDFRAEEED